MGTRADFYVGRGDGMEWLGSIGWDGYPEGIPPDILEATDEDCFRAAVSEFVTTHPEDGWPWPWETSHTTDYSYALDGGKVHATFFGHFWFDPLEAMPDEELNVNSVSFPDMSARTNVSDDPDKSGFIVY